MGVPGYRDTPAVAWDPDAPVDLDEAAEFLSLYHAERPGRGTLTHRLAHVRAEILATGTYTHTPQELTFGAQVAWRNASRCVGRLYWHSLQVLDRRTSRTAEHIFEDLVAHLRLASGLGRHRGQIRPVISVFPPAVPGHPFTRVWNDQLIRYAGYRDGPGDPRLVDFTETVQAMGWRGKGEAFEVLPLVVQTPDAEVSLFDLPEDTILEVRLAHPDHPVLADLGLRWYAVPAIANMRLSIGGVQYPLAPFNGWYMGTEIGARNLADPDRFDLLPVIAERLGYDTTSEATLWRDRAMVELNRAVLWSFHRDRVRISDHHTETRFFLTHVEREQRAGRLTPADWTWIVPPISGSATPVFHRYFHEADLRPNFYLDPIAQYLARGRTSR